MRILSNWTRSARMFADAAAKIERLGGITTVVAS